MKKHIFLAAIALLAIPVTARAQQAPSQVEGLCGLALTGQTVYDGACIFEKQADSAGAQTIVVQMSNGLNVEFLQPAGSNAWTVTTANSTLPVAIDPQPGAVTYTWEGASLTARAAGDTATTTAQPAQPTQPATSGGGLSIPGTGTSAPTSSGGSGNRILDRVIDRAADSAVDRASDAAADVLLQQLFGF